MGVAISGYKLAGAVAKAGEQLDCKVLAVVSGTGLPHVMSDRLKNGDYDTLRGLRAFDAILPGVLQEITFDYATGRRQPPKPEVMFQGNRNVADKMVRLSAAAAFTEVWLAKQGHNRPIGINLLEKVQLMHLPTLLGAMMADVDYVLVGAGIPNQIPKILNDFAEGKTASYRLDVEGLKDGATIQLDPNQFVRPGLVKRPKFLAIVSHDTLATYLNRKVAGVDGFIIEGPIAGGHNAPPRKKRVAEDGQPIYDEHDVPNLEKIAGFGKPFWLAGGWAGRLQEALSLGAGIQVGTPFALSDESGMNPDIAQEIRDSIAQGTLEVKTSTRVSPSGFPFQVVQRPGTLSDDDVFGSRKRLCNKGYLVQAACLQKAGSDEPEITFRCPAEPVNLYRRKGGALEDVDGRACLCNGLLALANWEQPREEIIVTLGKDLSFVEKLLQGKQGNHYSVKDVITRIFSL